MKKKEKHGIMPTLKELAAKIKWEESTAPVECSKPNGCGLYDMAGNVLEWCRDWYSNEQEYKVLRGGSWYGDAGDLRVAYRFHYIPIGRAPDVGFRCVADLP